MKCRKCGSEIPKLLLRQEAFRCPECGHMYRRKKQIQDAHSSTDGAERQSKTGSAWARRTEALDAKRGWIVRGLVAIGVLSVAVIILTSTIKPPQITQTKDREAVAQVVATAIQAPPEPTAVVYDSLWENAASKAFSKGYEVKGENNGVPFVTFSAESWNAGWAKKTFYAGICNFCEYLTSEAGYSDLQYSDITFFGTGPLVDTYGNSSIETIMRITVTKAEIDKVNWGNFLHENIVTIGENYWEHKALSN